VFAGAAALVVLGGWAAVIVAVLGAVALITLTLAAREGPGPLARRVRAGERWAPVALFALACLLSLRAPDPHVAGEPQLAAVAALVALWLGTTRVTTRRRAARPSAAHPPAEASGQ
jgi:arabinofuranan 3-O-arabinosyltransferase